MALLFPSAHHAIGAEAPVGRLQSAALGDGQIVQVEAALGHQPATLALRRENPEGHEHRDEVEIGTDRVPVRDRHRRQRCRQFGPLGLTQFLHRPGEATRGPDRLGRGLVAVHEGGDGVGQQGTRPSSYDAEVRIESADGQSLPRNFLTTTLTITSTTGVVREIAGLQTSPGVYDAVASDLEEGVYAAVINQRNPETGRTVAELKTGIVVPYASEYRLSLEATDDARRLLNQLTEQTGGSILLLSQPTDVWNRDIVPQPQRVPIWPWLLTAAIILFPLDVAVRRLTVSRSDVLRVLSRSRPS